ncbi:MAG TPA: tetratricopeptide repeat protein, partial [Planctomycetota bacterium]|nr:tetratricopeptide repeat protein [Planctomycetota bacterium]
MDVQEMIRLAEVLMEDWHMYDEAATVLRWARELFPEEEDAARLLVEALSKSGEEEEARKLSNELGPRDDPEDLMTHAIAQAAAFDYPKALELMARAIALSPDEEKFYARRGLIHFNAGA